MVPEILAEKEKIEKSEGKKGKNGFLSKHIAMRLKGMFAAAI